MKKLRPNIFLNLFPCAAFMAATALALSLEDTFARHEDCTCLPIAKCPPLLNLIKERKFREMIEQIRCGFEDREPLLCCPINGGKMNTGKLTERKPYNVTEVTETFEEAARSNITTGKTTEGVADDMTGEANTESLASIEGKNSSEPFNGFNDRYQDCSHIFENRVVHFEYKYYPSYWLYPFKNRLTGTKRLALYWATPNDAKSYASNTSYAKWIARPHHRKQGLALMSMAPEWENYYAKRWNGWKSYRAWIAGASYTSHIRDLDDATTMWRIYCTNECRTTGGENDLYDECILKQGVYWHYHEINGYSVFGTGEFDENWLSYRIYAPQTETYYEEVYKLDNCDKNNAPLTASYTARSSVTISSSTSHTASIGTTATWSIPFATILSGSSIESSVSYEWRQEDITATSEEREHTLGVGDSGKLVEPGKRWKIFQIAGNVGYWNIRSLTIASCDCDCNEECSPKGDGSCTGMRM